MCGIAGYWSFAQQNSEEWAAKFCSSLSHRGPNAHGHAQPSSNVILAHTRLSIIDTTDASNQPFQKKGYKEVLVFNGEIYNFQEVRTQLNTPPDGWQTKGDTEVLYELLLQRGLEGLSILNGMFAFAFWDANDTLLLVRDRFGIKPLYLLENAEGLAFASEQRALLPLTQRKTSLNALSEVLMWQCQPSLGTLLSEIRMMPPGSVIRVKDGKVVDEFKWYTWPNSSQGATEPVTEHEIRSLVDTSVRDRLISDVPFGAFLSGGIDSSVIVASMASQHNSPIRTFTVGFEDEYMDERPFAEQVAQVFGTHHQNLMLCQKDVLQWIPQAVADMDAPSADAINTWLVSKVTKEAGITVALSGLGGDEWFGGYPSFSRNHYLSFGWMKMVLPLFKPFSSLFPDEKTRIFLNSSRTPEEVVKVSRQLFTPSRLQELNLNEPSFTYQTKSKGQKAISETEVALYTQPLLLRDTDQMSMAHALEVRVPFFDFRLIERCAHLTDTQRYNPKKPLKHLLIQAYKQELPEAVWNRPKRGFVLPMSNWMKGPLKSYSETGIFDSPLSEIMRTPYVYTLWKNFLSEDSMSKEWSRLWMLAVLGHWLTQHKIQLQ